MSVVIYCADIGSVARARFVWARSDRAGIEIERDRGGSEIVDLVNGVAADLEVGRAVALGFECPLFAPVAEAPSPWHRSFRRREPCVVGRRRYQRAGDGDRRGRLDPQRAAFP